MNNKMFCYQCQETAGCKGCTVRGVCGKTPELAAMQDVLIYVTKGLACVTTKLRTQKENISSEVNYLITLNLFTTITNANFDRDVIVNRIKAVSYTHRDVYKRQIYGRAELTDIWTASPKSVNLFIKWFKSL